ncbi:hypothetical protein KEM54_005135 [Ascosphaera aggregata]|nr:hypothetical protein KEM54_005135 [Ascosphaera aggregata]
MAPSSPTRKDSVSSLISDSAASTATGALVPTALDDPSASSNCAQATRTTTLDSNVTSIPSSNTPFSVPSAAEIEQLITAAGSPEEAIIRLLKEKHALANQNSSLWKLVEKQRPMLIGLNRDLDCAIRDKERYRKRLKELYASWKKSDGRILEETIRNSLEEQDKEDHTTESAGTTFEQAVAPQAESTTSQQLAESLPSHRAGELPLRASSAVSPPVFAAMKEKRASLAATFKRSVPAPLDFSSQVQVSAIAEDSASEYEDHVSTDTAEANRQYKHKQNQGKSREEPDNSQKKPEPKEKQAKKPELSFSKNRKKAPTKSLSISLPEKLHRSVTHPGHVASVQTPLTPFWKRHREEHHHPTNNSIHIFSTPSNGTDSLQTKSPPSVGSLAEPVNKLPLVTNISAKDVHHPMSGNGPKVSSSRTSTTEIVSSPDSTLTRRQPSEREEGLKDAIDVKRSEERVPMQGKDKDSQSKSENVGRKPTKPHIRVASPVPMASQIYTGLVSNDFPDLLVPPTSLHRIEIRVASSRMRPRRHSYLSPPSKQTEDDSVFTLGVFYRYPDRIVTDGDISPTFPARELWRVEKSNASLQPLDTTLKTLVELAERLPDRAAFTGHSPAKVDARRTALNNYFEAALNTVTGSGGNAAAQMEICQFLSTDVIEPRDDETTFIDWKRGKLNLTSLIPEQTGSPELDDRPKMEGYLTKRGKNFGGWKARYFVLHSPKLMYYECPGGTHLGTIKIRYAQIGKQSADDPQNSNANVGTPGSASGHDDSENQYRHAFLILEPKKRDSNALVRHVLCAESDEERDAWVDALLAYVEDRDEDDAASYSSWKTATNVSRPITSSGANPNKKKKIERTGAVDTHESLADGMTVRSLSYDSLVSNEAAGPVETVVNTKKADEQQRQLHSHFNISGPTNGSVIRDASTWGNVALSRNGATPLKEKKRSIWNFNRGGSSSSTTEDKGLETKELVVPVFGLPLSDAVRLCAPRKSEKGMESGLTAVAYRCVEYLRAHDASKEEGIFRLSGSNIIVRQLKDRFNVEGDVDLLSEGEPYFDVHAVASLFKQYLRELPESLLTHDLHYEFFKVLDLPDHRKKLSAFTTLLGLLPPPNKTLLSTLMELLHDIVNNCEVSRMTVRNVGIVFAPTLNIPAPVISMFLNDYDMIFGSVPLDDESAAGDGAEDLQPLELTSPELQNEIPDSDEQNQQDKDKVDSKRPVTQDLTTPASTSLADSSVTALPSSPSPVVGPDRGVSDTGLAPMREAPSPRPPHEGNKSDFRATTSGLNGLVAPPGENGGGGNLSAKQKRRQSGLFHMDMNQLDIKEAGQTTIEQAANESR